MSQNDFKNILKEYENKMMNSSRSSPIKNEHLNLFLSNSKKG